LYILSCAWNTKEEATSTNTKEIAAILAERLPADERRMAVKMLTREDPVPTRTTRSAQSMAGSSADVLAASPCRDTAFAFKVRSTAAATR
jgi:hypothetical protein